MIDSITEVNDFLQTYPGLRFVDLVMYRDIVEAEEPVAQLDIRRNTEVYGSFKPALKGLETLVGYGLIDKHFTRSGAPGAARAYYTKPMSREAEQLDPFTGAPLAEDTRGVEVQAVAYVEDEGCRNVF